MVVIAASGNERRLTPVTLGQRETEHATIESKRTLKVGDLEMHMTDGNSWINRSHGESKPAFLVIVNIEEEADTRRVRTTLRDVTTNTS